MVMIKAFLAFIVFTGLIAGSIVSLRQISGKQRWEFAKLVAFSATCSIISIIILTFIAFLF
jgi:hypothetical protein